MKVVVKFGGTSISSSKNIRSVGQFLHSLSKQNQIVVVCSAVSGITDDLINISNLIQKGEKNQAKLVIEKIIKNLEKDNRKPLI